MINWQDSHFQHFAILFSILFTIPTFMRYFAFVFVLFGLALSVTKHFRAPSYDNSCRNVSVNLSGYRSTVVFTIMLSAHVEQK